MKNEPEIKFIALIIRIGNNLRLTIPKEIEKKFALDVKQHVKVKIERIPL